MLAASFIRPQNDGPDSTMGHDHRGVLGSKPRPHTELCGPRQLRRSHAREAGGQAKRPAQAEEIISAFIAIYTIHHAHPCTWKKGIHFYQCLKDKLQDKQAETGAPLAA